MRVSKSGEPRFVGFFSSSGRVGRRSAQLRRAIRRNRVFVVTLLVVGALVGLLIGFGGAQGFWYPPYWDLSQPPAPRFGAATTYDWARQRIVLFGGFVSETNPNNPASLGGPPISTNGQTYLYQSGWERRDPLHSPPARGFAAMAYDGGRRNVVLFGGGRYNSNNVFGDTWTWDGQDWTQQSPPQPVPDPRQNAVMVYDPHRKVVMMFGGRGADGKPMNDTWLWNGSAWKIMPPEGAPSPRHSAAIAYDVCRAEAVMFGGVGPPENNFFRQPSETWTWDGAKWTPEAPLVSPPPRIGAHLAYSDRTGNVLLYGGLITNDAGVPTAAADHDLWRWVPEDPIGIPDGPTRNGLWERMNTEAGPADNYVLAQAGGDGVIRAQAPPRAYGTFHHIGQGHLGDTFYLFGGTPSAGTTNGIQLAYGDQFFFQDRSIWGGLQDQRQAAEAPNTPLLRECRNPVPVPEDDPSKFATSGPQFAVREGMREIAQLPVLTGTDWPHKQRDTHIYGGQKLPNPDYTPPPDCPRRTTENGAATHLVTDGRRNRVYQFFQCDPNRGAGYTGQYWGNYPNVYNLLIEAYDGTTLKPLGKVVVKNVGQEYGGFLASLGHDADLGRFIVKNSYWNGSTTVSELVVIRQDLIEKGESPVAGTLPYTGFPFDTFFRHPKTGRAKLLSYFSGSVSLAGPVGGVAPKLAQWDVESGREDWRIDLTGCVQESIGSTSFFRPTAMRSGNRAYTVCSFGNSQYGVVRVSLTENADGSETPGSVEGFPGPAWLYDTWGDAQSERMMLYGGSTYTVWIFDGKTSRWVGRIGIGSGFNRQWGFDKEAGRLYAHLPDNVVGGFGYTFGTQGGVLVLDTRLTPAPQAMTFPQFASPPAYLGKIASLPSLPGVSRRMFIRVTAGNMKKHPNWETVKFDNEMFYRVLADELPVPKIADLSDLDALTIPVAEAPGKTEVGFDAEGSSYGIRLRSVGGVWSASRPPQQMFDQSQFFDDALLNLGRPFMPACLFPDRELMAGLVSQARLSDLDALARSSGLEVDSNSKVDLTGPFSRCNPTANASNFPPSIKGVFDVLWPLWQMVQFEGNEAASSGTVDVGKDADGNTTRTDTPLGALDQGRDKDGNPTAKFSAPTSSSWESHFKEVVCVGDALATNQAAVGNIYGSAKCVQRQGLVEASAKGSATGAGPASSAATSAGFSVGEANSTVVVKRDTVKGIVVTATAVARGIQLPIVTQGGVSSPPLSIDRVETRAEAWSNGRPGEERATFTRYICGVHDPDGRIPNGCLSSQQQQQMVDNWNARWGKNSKMFLPKPDPDYFQGSPGGYIAGVIKPIADEIEDQLFAKDFQREVPGLVIEFYKDSINQGNARQSLMLAAVRAVAGLAVQCNPDLLYSPQAKDCVSLPDDLAEEEFFEDEDVEFEDSEFELEGEWIPGDSLAAGGGESLGRRIGRFLRGLPVISRLPIREIGEAILAWSVWLLLAMPLLLAWRRMTLNLGGTE